MDNPVQYLEMGSLDEYGYLRKPGWYFWDETWSYAYGPYDTEEIANNELQQYGDKL